MANTEFELTADAVYEFSSDAIATNDRFSVIFKSSGSITGLNNSTAKSFTVFKSANDQLTVYVDGISGTSYKLSIYNALGQQVYTNQFSKQRNDFNFNQKPGVYIVKLNNSETSLSQKVIIK